MTGAPVVRPAHAEDLDFIHHIETTAFDLDRLSRRSLRRFLAVPTTDALVAVTAEGVAGYAMIGFRRTSRIGRVFSLAVAARHARRGIGGMLLEACEAAAWRRDCAVVSLEVRTDNAAAIALYRRAGYQACGTIDDFYEDGATALVFEKARPAMAPAPLNG